MTPRTSRRASSPAIATAVLLTGLVTAALAGCGTGPATPGAGSATDPDPSPSASASGSPGAGERLGAPARPRPSGQRTAVVEAPPRPRGNALTVRGSGPDGHLVAAADLGRRWREQSTGDEGERVMSPCHAATLHDVGADRVRLRDFTGPGHAVQAAARFVDRRSALRIERVVQAWESRCTDDLDARDAALGVVRHGRWLAVVEVADLARPHRRLTRALDAAAATF